MKITHSVALTQPSHLLTQVSSFSFSPECNDYQPGQHLKMTQLPTTLHPSTLCPAFTETPDSTRMQWQLMHQFHSCTASWVFPHGHQSTTAIMPEELVLMWTLLQPTLDTPWQHTYAWMDNWMDLLRQSTTVISNKPISSSPSSLMVPISQRHCGTHPMTICHFHSCDTSICHVLFSHLKPISSTLL